MLTVERLKELVHYDSETGDFTALVARGKIRVGDRLGCVNDKGYVVFWLEGKLRYAHRLAWLYTHGKWPENEIDHDNRVKSDNWIDNLLDATSVQNNRNREMPPSSLGLPQGVTVNKNKYQARIRVDGTRYSLGNFTSAEKAGKVCALAREQVKNKNFEILKFLENLQVA